MIYVLRKVNSEIEGFFQILLVALQDSWCKRFSATIATNHMAGISHVHKVCLKERVCEYCFCNVWIR